MKDNALERVKHDKCGETSRESTVWARTALICQWPPAYSRRTWPPRSGTSVVIKRVLRHLRAYPQGLFKFKMGNDDWTMHDWTDRDWAGDVSTRRSRSGGSF